MAEDETLDLGHYRSGRWQKLRDSIRAGKSANEVADEGGRCLTQTFKNLQKLFEENNGIPLKQVLIAAKGEDGSFDEIMRQARFGRDYLQFFASYEESVGNFAPESPIRPVFPVFSPFCGLGHFGDQISMELAAPRIA